MKSIVLAYSGGLDTSIIIPWLKEQFPATKVLCISINVGQLEDWDEVKTRARRSGADDINIIDARDEFARDYIAPLLRAGAVYEHHYLQGTAIARPLQAKKQVEYALAEKAEALAHGCTGKGNDQIRFEMAYRALAPHLPIIAPWRIWDIQSREEAIAYARKRKIPLGEVSEANIYSRDANLWHMSHEGGPLEDPGQAAPEEVYQLTQSPLTAARQPQNIRVGFRQSRPVSLDGKAHSEREIIEQLNALGGRHGIGRIDIIESRVTGMKVRGVYETPGGSILLSALRDLEAYTMDAESMSEKTRLAIRYSELVYQGKWFSPLREAIDAAMASMATMVTGEVEMQLYKGSATVLSRSAEHPLYDNDIASFGASDYSHSDAAGFIQLFGLSTKIHALRKPPADV